MKADSLMVITGQQHVDRSLVSHGSQQVAIQGFGSDSGV